MPAIPMITWHAGAMHTRANTLGSIEKAIAHNAQIVEFDVTFAPDSTPVIIHSASPAQGKGELLRSAFAVVAKSDSCKINLDLKAYSNLPAVDALAGEFGLSERVFFTGVEENQTAQVAASSKIPYYLNGKISLSARDNFQALQSYAQMIIDCGAIGLNTHFTNITPEVVRVMHGEGLLVSAWTANSAAVQKMLIDAGVDNITTKAPCRLQKLLCSLYKNQSSFSQK